MEFRLDFEKITEARCRACLITGGEVEDEEHAEALSSLPELRGGHAEVGTQLEPCVPDHYLGWFEANKGRPCPRVELHILNSTAADLTMLLLSPHTVPLFDRKFEALHGEDEPDERAALLTRIGNALHSSPVTERLYPQPKEPSTPKRTR